MVDTGSYRFVLHSLPHWLASNSSKSAREPLFDFNLFVLAPKHLRVYFQILKLSSVERHQWELLLIVLEKRPQLKVVLRVKIGLHCHVVLYEL